MSIAGDYKITRKEFLEHYSPVRTHTPSGDSFPARSLWRSLRAEITGGYGMEAEDPKLQAHRRRVYTFLTIPLNMEKFFMFGLLICLDSFLFLVTLLPLRCVYAIIRLCSLRLKQYRSGQCCGPTLLPGHKYDLLMGCLVVVCTVLTLAFIDSSYIYHYIRSQAVIKLYIFFNMLEIADRLLSAVGQDVLDALALTVTEQKSSRLILLNWLFATVVVFLHTCLFLLQALTLNVGFNSHNRTLLTIMMSNNFVELKASVFRKFAEENLFQLACADIRERFHLVVLLTAVILRNMKAVHWEAAHLLELLPDVVLVYITEILVDSVKHAFISKFNELPNLSYFSFSARLAYDVRRSRNHMHYLTVTRRMGLTPLPLAVFILKILYNTLWDLSPFSLILCAICLLPLKLIVQRWLHNIAESIVKQYETTAEPPQTDTGNMRRSHSVVDLAAPVPESTDTPNRRHERRLSDVEQEIRQRRQLSESRREEEPLNEIDRYSMYSNTIV